jgi:transcription elongation factor Elf1
MATIMIKGWPEEINGNCPKCGDTHVVEKSSTWAKWSECGICGATIEKAETEAAEIFTNTASTGTRIVSRRQSDDPYGHGE